MNARDLIRRTRQLIDESQRGRDITPLLDATASLSGRYVVVDEGRRINSGWRITDGASGRSPRTEVVSLYAPDRPCSSTQPLVFDTQAVAHLLHVADEAMARLENENERLRTAVAASSSASIEPFQLNQITALQAAQALAVQERNRADLYVADSRRLKELRLILKALLAD